MSKININDEQLNQLRTFAVAGTALLAQAFFRSGGTQEMWEAVTQGNCVLSSHDNDVYWKATQGDEQARNQIATGMGLPDYSVLQAYDIGNILQQAATAPVGTPSPINDVPLAG